MIHPISRRAFLAATAAGTVATADAAGGANIQTLQKVVTEWTFTSTKTYRDPYNEIDLDMTIDGPGRESWRVPAFWAGDLNWRIRFAPPAPGRYRYRTECTDTSNTSLHGIEGTIQAAEYGGSNPLLTHGAIRLDEARRYFQHSDGTPFFFLGDDWWHGMTSRLRWPDEFRALALDRRRKGYTVIKMTAGLNCDVSHFDPRNHNESGHCYRPKYASIRPEFFDLADLRVEYLVEQGLVPCIVGAWGYYLADMGVERMKKHWRYVVARWGAYPVVWQLTMESDMPFYGSTGREQEVQMQRTGWSEVGHYLRTLDPFHRLITLQPSGTRGIARRGVTDPSFLDFDSMQCGHGDYESFLRMVRLLGDAQDHHIPMPALPGEVCFEGIGRQNWQNIQRRVFWGSLLNGAAGFCYGANGIWQFNREGEPFGPSPHGRTWGGAPWNVAAQYEGCRQIGVGKKLLERFPFWQLEPHPEWVRDKPLGADGDYRPPYAAGIPGRLRICYYENTWAPGVTIKALETGVRYRAFWFDPASGDEHPIGEVSADANSEWTTPKLPGIYDHLLVMKTSA